MLTAQITSVDVFCSQGSEADRARAKQLCADTDAFPFPLSASALELLPSLQAIEHNFGAGALHIAMEDGNLEDRDLDFCIIEAIKDGNAEEERIARALRALPVNDRVALYSCFVPNEFTEEDLD